MRNTVSKAIIAGVAALAIGASLVATTEPAAAQWRRRRLGRRRLAWRRLGRRLAWRRLGRRRRAAACGTRATGATAAGITGGGVRRWPPGALDRRRGGGGAGGYYGGYSARSTATATPASRFARSMRRTAPGSATARSTSASKRDLRASRTKAKGPARSEALFIWARARSAAGHRPGDAGRGRKDDRQAASRAQREIGETLRLDRVAVQADRLDRLDRHAEPLCEARASTPDCAARLRRPASAPAPRTRASARRLSPRR